MGVEENSLEENPRDNSGVYLRIALLPYYIIQEYYILLVSRKTIQGGKTWAQTTLHGKMIQNRILNMKSLAIP